MYLFIHYDCAATAAVYTALYGTGDVLVPIQYVKNQEFSTRVGTIVDR